MLINDVLAWSAQYPGDWQKVWHLIEDKWDKRDPCPDGALRPFNIDAKLNGGYIVVGLLYGQRDFGKTGGSAGRRPWFYCGEVASVRYGLRVRVSRRV